MNGDFLFFFPSLTYMLHEHKETPSEPHIFTVSTATEPHSCTASGSSSPSDRGQCVRPLRCLSHHNPAPVSGQMGRHQRANLNVKDTISREWSTNAVLAIRLESMLGAGGSGQVKVACCELENEALLSPLYSFGQNINSAGQYS